MATLNTSPSSWRILATNERVTEVPARAMLRQTIGGGTKPIQILDNACGSGVIAAQVLKNHLEFPPIGNITSADINDNMVAYVERWIEERMVPNATVMKFDQQSAPLPDHSFTHILNNFGIFFSRDDRATLSESFRLLKPGGKAGFTTWKANTWWHSLALPACQKYIPDMPGLPVPGTKLPSKGWDEPGVIDSKLRAAGFQDIVITPYNFRPDGDGIEIENFAEATAFLVKSVAKIAWPAEDYEKFADAIEPALLNYLKEQYPYGHWNGEMSALISTATRPEAV